MYKNKNKNFFDNIDNGWDKLIADVYNANSIIFSSNKNCFNDNYLEIRVDLEKFDAVQEYDVNYSYKEVYTDKSNKFKVIMLYNPSVTLYNNTTEVVLYIVNGNYNNESIFSDRVTIYNKFMIYVSATSDYGKYTRLEQKENEITNVPSDAECRINHTFFKEFVKRALKATNYEERLNSYSSQYHIYKSLGHQYDILERAINEAPSI